MPYLKKKEAKYETRTRPSITFVHKSEFINLFVSLLTKQEFFFYFVEIEIYLDPLTVNVKCLMLKSEMKIVTVYPEY